MDWAWMVQIPHRTWLTQRNFQPLASSDSLSSFFTYLDVLLSASLGSMLRLVLHGIAEPQFSHEHL
jgi:hypothetical protein